MFFSVIHSLGNISVQITTHKIREHKLKLEGLGEILETRNLRWGEIQTMEMDYEEARRHFDHECGIPSLKQGALARAA